MKYLAKFFKYKPDGGTKSDRWLMGIIVVLALFGVLMVYDSSVAIAIRDFGDQYYYAREQLKWLLLGMIALVTLSRVDYRLWRQFALPSILVTMALLVAVFIPGFGVRALGAHRWLNFGVFILQPAELAKLVLVLYLAAWFSAREKDRFGAFLLLCGIIFGLVIIEPDLGTGIVIICTALIMYFLSGAPIRHFAFLLPILIIGVTILAVTSPYRFRRLTTFLDTKSDPLGASYQIRQVLLSLGSGGLTGIGIGKSRQKYEYLPESNTDSIFAIIGEETGFVGATLVVMVYAFFVWRIFWVGSQVANSFGKLFAFGIGAWVGVQSILNIGAMTALLPLTGIPLPLLSYGGSSLVILLAASGIVLNISKHRS
ncbi:putative lipid II flippase FtsW [Candidatus Gottesmanbacteria bacterium]|nr:putative lipid II flippase FtsW [Candidatus Gottesmanbacteria bacterium]